MRWLIPACSMPLFALILMGNTNGCETEETDADGDGYTTSQGDCNDADPYIYPGAAESCDEIDNDCDGQVDDGALNRFYPDADADGYGDETGLVQACTPPHGYTSTGGDCDDQDAAVHPEAVEACDSKDNDCNGRTDDGDCLEDDDWDGFPANKDCDDDDPTINLAYTELCGDAKDNDCDGTVDESGCQVDTAAIRYFDSGVFSELVGCGGGACVDAFTFWIDAKVANLAFEKLVWIEITTDPSQSFAAYTLDYEQPLDATYERWGGELLLCQRSSSGFTDCAAEYTYRLKYSVNGKTYVDDNGGRGYHVNLGD